MGGWFGVIVGVAAGVLFYRADSDLLMWLTIAATILNFWSFGVAHNQAVEAAKQRPDYSGGFYDFTNRDLRGVSDRLMLVNMLTTVGLIGLLITALIYAF